MKLQEQAILNGKHVHKLAWARAKSLKAIPAYSKHPKHRLKILKIYIDAQIRNIRSKVKFQVDHIIPLYHPLVCGLHVHENLQVLSQVKNSAKSNDFQCYREINGRKYYYGASQRSDRALKLRKSTNPTKKNPTKLAKRRSKVRKPAKKYVRRIKK